MARLNEPIGTADPLDALKRRFLRQNRDLARTNSSQSIRIRTLETEVATILAENLELREQIIKLQLDLDSRPENDLLDSLMPLHTQVQSKLLELGSLVKDLGEVQAVMERCRTRGALHAQRVLEDGSGTSKPPMAQVLGSGLKSQEGRLPSIMEDKCFPRRSIGCDEVYPVRNDISQDEGVGSPDLGSPPTMSFTVTGSGGSDDESSQQREMGEPIVQNPPVAAFSNLEVRRKRRDSSTLLSTNAESVANQRDNRQRSPERRLGQTVAPIKLGAKRKMTAREEGPEVAYSSHGAAQSHVHQRKEDPASSRGPSRVINENIESKIAQKSLTSLESEKRPDRTIHSAARKALGPKCVNTDPVTSPVKARAKDISIPNLKDTANAQKIRKRAGRSEQAGEVNIEDRQKGRRSATTVAATEARSTPFETPIFAASDFVSPASSEVSSVDAISQDTPPPSNLNIASCTAGEKDCMGRSSRRAKGAVSYVQPNLRDKMRRPTKELVDAVVGDRRSHSTSGADARPTSDSEPIENEMRKVVIKREVEPYDDGRDMIRDPSSPLRNKNSGDDAGAGVIRRRRRRDTVAHGGAEAQDISCVSADRLGTVMIKPERDISICSRIQPDIFDFQSSSPSTDTSSMTSSQDAPQGRRVTHRRSSVQTLRAEKPPATVEVSLGTRLGAGKRGDILKGLAESFDRLSEDERTKVGFRSSNGGQGERGKAHAERIASRRRSMML